ncbi:MAG: SDR family oxidoreductase, partial [Anaerolineales bacterium]
VTAASKGLGRAVAREFAREGARVVMCARSHALDQAAETIRVETGAQVLAVRADLTRAEDIEALIEATLGKFGRIDILFANSGGPKPGNFLDLTPKDWEEAVQVVLMSMVRLCYAVIPQMLHQGGGSIVANQSYSVKQPIDNLILSNSIRMAVIGLMKSLANEFGPKGIRINTINPTWTMTERVAQLMADRAKRKGTSIEQEMARVAVEVPLGRMGTVEEYARAVVWLASPAASFIHGHALMFDGGAVRATL